MGFYHIAVNLPMWLDLAYSATCKKNGVRWDRGALCVFQDGKAKENQLVLAGPGAPLSKHEGSLKDQMTLFSAKERTWKEIKWQPRMKGQVETDL